MLRWPAGPRLSAWREARVCGSSLEEALEAILRAPEPGLPDLGPAFA